MLSVQEHLLFQRKQLIINTDDLYFQLTLTLNAV